MFANFEGIKIGDTRTLKKKITELDVRKFVEITGDDNPLHVDRKYAEATSFRDIVVHGMLGASFISTVIGTKLPGHGALWVSQSMDFLLPVRLDDELAIRCTVIRKHERERLLELETVIENQNGQMVLNGVGKVKVLGERKEPTVAALIDRSRVAIVTGGAGGIGQAICLRLAKDGFDVVLAYKNSGAQAARIVEEINAGKTNAIAVRADVGTAEGVAAICTAATRSFGAVGVIVNAASPRINPKAFAATEWSDVQQHLDVQLMGAFLLAKKCLPEMMARKWGRIISITSQAIEGSPSVGWTSYALAKSGLSTLSRYLAAEFGPSGITVNCISPSLTETALIGDISAKAQLLVARQTPLRRLAVPVDIASSVSYLASDDAAFVTGHTLRVNGGQVML
jgi:3-oxoacyl-[acyl-carrier protein] reductase